MEAFATVGDLEARWRPLSDAEKARAEVLLDDASVLVAGSGARTGSAEAKRIVVCSMVKRVMMSPVDRPSVESAQTTVGPFSESLSYANPSGDLYMTSAEKRMLGIGRQRIGSIRPAIRGYGGDPHDR